MSKESILFFIVMRLMEHYENNCIICIPNFTIGSIDGDEPTRLIAYPDDPEKNRELADVFYDEPDLMNEVKHAVSEVFHQDPTTVSVIDAFINKEVHPLKQQGFFDMLNELKS